MDDHGISALARRQHGVVARRQLAALGLSRNMIDRRVAVGRLHVVHRGVYAVGHTALSRYGRWMAAVLACGTGAALSHASAGALWEIRASAAILIDVSVPRAGGRKRPGLRIHRAATLLADEVAVHCGIPVTTPARTLLDLAAILQPRPLERALDEAEKRELTDYPALEALARAHPGHRGARNLQRVILGHLAGTTMTKSVLEERFLELCRDHGLPKPLVNWWVEAKEVDFFFAEHRLIAETDSWTHHRTRRAFENDRARDALLARAGYRTLRFTHRQIQDDPTTVAATIRSQLAADRSAAAA